MSIQTKHLLCDIIYYIFMGWNFFPITHLLLVSFICGIQSEALRLTSESKGLPKVYNMLWDCVNIHTRLKSAHIHKKNWCMEFAFIVTLRPLVAVVIMTGAAG